MIASEFLEGYPRELTEAEIYRGIKLPIVRDVQKYSYGYGLIVHAALGGERDQIPDLLDPLREFENNIDYKTIEQALLNEPKNWRYRNKVNFYALNECMRPMWTPLITGSWPSETDRIQVINTSMDLLAARATTYCSQRDQIIQNKGTDYFYGEENWPFEKRFTGALQEIDVTYAALAWACQEPNITVVPAPVQFEQRYCEEKADVLVIDMVRSRLMGLQSKTNATDTSPESVPLDRRRIVHVNGTNDFGTTREVYIMRRGRLVQKTVPWPGIVAASRLLDVQLANDSSAAFQNLGPYPSINYDGLTKLIENRVMKLL